MLKCVRPQAVFLSLVCALFLGACGDDDPAPAEPRRDTAPRFVEEWSIDNAGRESFFALAVDSLGVVYAADLLTGKIQLFSRDGEKLGEWRGPVPDDSVFMAPISIAVASDGSIVVADEIRDRILRLSPDGEVLDTWGDEGPEALRRPFGIAVDRNDNVYVADNHAYKIVKYASDGSFVKSWPVGLPIGPRHWGPLNLAVTPRETLLMTEWHGYRVYEFSLDGDSLNQWSAVAKLDNTYGLAVDAHGDVYVGDYSFSTVNKFTSDGEFLATTDNPFDVPGGLIFPEQLAIQNQQLFVLDGTRAKILKFDLE